jgi:hypothetical protein
MDAYYRKLNGKQAAWASKKYWGHRVLPSDVPAWLGLEAMALAWL